MKEPNGEGEDDQDNRENSHSDESLLILRCVDLLPYDKGQPSLEDISHFVHASNYQGSFFVVLGANFMGPASVIVKK